MEELIKKLFLRVKNYNDVDLSTFIGQSRQLLDKIETFLLKKVEASLSSGFDIVESLLKRNHSKEWKDYVTGGVVENIFLILDDCYEPYQDILLKDYPSKKHILGQSRYSPEWEHFLKLTINSLLDPKNFSEDDDYFDTAGGCDEIAWDEGLKVLETLAK